MRTIIVDYFRNDPFNIGDYYVLTGPDLFLGAQTTGTGTKKEFFFLMIDMSET